MPKLRECINFTESYLIKLPPTESGKRYVVHDIKCNGLWLRVTDKGIKSFIIQHRVNDKIVKVTLGIYPKLALKDARDKFWDEIKVITKGINPNELKYSKRLIWRVHGTLF